MASWHQSVWQRIEDLVDNPSILALHRRWAELRKAGSTECLPPLAPFAGDLLGEQAAYMMVVQAEGEHFHYRHYGSEMLRASGVDMTGRRVAEFGGEIGELLLACFRQAVARSQALYTVHHCDRVRSVYTWELLSLPVMDEAGGIWLVVFHAPLQSRKELLESVLNASNDAVLALRILDDTAVPSDDKAVPLDHKAQPLDDLPAGLEPVRARHAGLANALVVVANHRCTELLGMQGPDPMGRRLAEVMPLWCDLGLQRHADRALASWKAVEFECDITVNRVVRRLSGQVAPMRQGLTLRFTDITERSTAERSLRELTQIFDNTTDFVMQTDARGNVTYMNPAARRSSGVAADAPVADRNFAEFNTPATNERFQSVILPAVQASGVWVGETTVYDAGRRELPVNHMVIAHRDESGQIERYSALLRDISAKVTAQQKDMRHMATLRSITESIPAYVAVVGTDGRYRFVNSAFERWHGAPRDSIVGRSAQEMLGQVEWERSQPWFERALAGEAVRFEKEYAAPPGRLAAPASHGGHEAVARSGDSCGAAGAIHLAIDFIPLWLDDGQLDGFISVAQDITPHKQENVRLLRLSQRDALTGLLNRAGFESYLDRCLRDGAGASLALLYIDLDHFKPVNDQYGHHVGDQVLQWFARQLQQLVRPTDAVARLGGDEFVIVLSGLREPAHAQAVAEKVIAASQREIMLGALRLKMSASVGVAFGADAASGWGDLLARADSMLYRAKAAGRGQHAGTTELGTLV